MSPYETWQLEKYGNIVPEYKSPLTLTFDENRDLEGWHPFDNGNQILIEE